jgi:hypothetical protein
MARLGVDGMLGLDFLQAFSSPYLRTRPGLAKPPATRYNRRMIETTLPLAPEPWATV